LPSDGRGGFLYSSSSLCSGVGVSLRPLSSPSLPISLFSLSVSSLALLLDFFLSFFLLFFKKPEFSFLLPVEPLSMESLSEFADLSEMSEGGPPEIAVAAFRDVRLIFSASNSMGPGLTSPVYF